MAFINYKYYSGGFSAVFAKTNRSGFPASVDLGTTSDGVRVLVDPEGHEIREDRCGSNVVEIMLTGIRRMMVVMNSMIWKDDAQTPDLPMLDIATMLASDGDGGSPGTIANEAIGGLAAYGSSAPAYKGLAGTLTLTAVTGRLRGSTGATTTPYKLTFPVAIPLDSFELLLTLPRPIEVPLHFQILPDMSASSFTTDGDLKYYTQQLGDAA